MNTIEMLKELVENGGMFTQDARHADDEPRIVSYDETFGVCCVTEDRAYKGTITMWESFIKTTWKPYVKPVDWSKVPIDTKVYARDLKMSWYKRYYAGFRDGKPTVWEDGCTSWSILCEDDIEYWNEIKLADATE